MPHEDAVTRRRHDDHTTPGVHTTPGEGVRGLVSGARATRVKTAVGTLFLSCKLALWAFDLGVAVQQFLLPRQGLRGPPTTRHDEKYQ